MALDSDRLGAAIAATVVSFRPPAGTSISDAQLVALWKAIASDIVDEINNFAAIDLNAADISVPGVGLIDSTSGPVTGVAASAPTGPLIGRIK